MAYELRQSRPPEQFRAVHEWVLDNPAELANLRDSLHRALTGAPLPRGAGLGRVPEKIVLVASELATNALKHGVPPTTVQLSTAGDESLLDVADHDVDATPHVPAPRPPGEGGFGLYLADRLSLDVGWYVTPSAKHVWARFADDDADAEGQLDP